MNIDNTNLRFYKVCVTLFWRWSYAKKRSRAEKTRVVLKQIDCFSRYRISKGDYRDSSLWQIQSDEVNGLSFERKWSGSGTDYTDEF